MKYHSKSQYPCPACGAKTLEYIQPLNTSCRVIHCENPYCMSDVCKDGATGDTEAEAYEQLKRRVEEEK